MSPTAGAGRRRASRSGPGWNLPTWLALGSCVLYVLLTLLVVTGATQALDEAVLHRLRPGDAWNDPQVRWSPWMSRLRPSRTYLLLAVTSVVVSLWRRSWWPSFLGLALAGVSGVVALATKVAVHRPDPHGYVTETGGAYPSGHTVALVVCLSGCLLVCWPRVRWWLWAPVLAATALLTTALLVAGAHWLTDVVGGLLLAFAVVAGSSRTALRRKAHRQPPRTGEDARPPSDTAVIDR